MTPETEASRTLVKSPPELWAEVSDPSSLARHLDGFGEIRITRLEPETAVAWEGDQVSGTVRLEPSGWGTRVLLTAKGAEREPRSESAGPGEAEALPEPGALPVAGAAAAAPHEAAASLEPEPQHEAVAPPESEAPPEPEPQRDPPAPAAAAPQPQRRPEPVRRQGLLARIIGLFRGPELRDLELHSAALEPPREERKPATERGGAPEQRAASERVANPEEAAREAPAGQERHGCPESPATQSSEPVGKPEPAPFAESVVLPETQASLIAALDSLGQAHHRPFSRA
jgi:hypothetical protein